MFPSIDDDHCQLGLLNSLVRFHALPLTQVQLRYANGVPRFVRDSMVKVVAKLGGLDKYARSCSSKRRLTHFLQHAVAHLELTPWKVIDFGSGCISARFPPQLRLEMRKDVRVVTNVSVWRSGLNKSTVPSRIDQYEDSTGFIDNFAKNDHVE